MATITSTSLSAPAASHAGSSRSLVSPLASLVAGFKAFWRQFFVKAFDPYRPELHYMRGPGPAWHAKHGASAAFRLKSDDL
jgi:hypothetical protein